MTGSAPSAGAVARARREAQARGLDIPFSVADVRSCDSHHAGRSFDVVLCADNSVTHLLTEADIAETASRLDADAERCRPTAESFVNPAKSLALDLGGSIPIVWGSSALATVAARRFADTLSANAR